MILKPVVSEKAIAQAEEENTYIFHVPKSVNKHDIAKEVTHRFDVTVTRVRTTTSKGKSKQMPVQGGRKLISGRRSDMKKAFVTLQSDDNIPLFEGSQ